MDWLVNLFTGDGIATAVIVLALTIAIGLFLNRIKFGSVSLGVTWVLFAGIVLSHFGLTINHEICHFIKEFGLILFVYSIGIQVGPSFISSLRDGGIKLNMLAMLIIFLGCCICYGIHIITGEELTTMVGVLSGAVTNTQVWVLRRVWPAIRPQRWQQPMRWHIRLELWVSFSRCCSSAGCSASRSTARLRRLPARMLLAPCVSMFE